MGDMGDFWRDIHEARKARRKDRLKSADPSGWTQHSEFHWSQMLNGKRLDYWPSTGRFRWGGGKTMSGDVNGFIRKRMI